MATPYWGQLPGPKVVKNRQQPDDNATAPSDPRHSDPQPPRKQNRTSVQTAVTANTDSTFGPYSPTASIFSPRGLAPRPPSYQRGPEAVDVPERKARRPSHIADDYDEEQDNQEADHARSPPPPAAPDVPRAPPSSYRHPHGNGGLPYTYSASGAAGPPQLAGQPPQGGNMDLEDYYRNRNDGRPAGPYPTAIDSGARDQAQPRAPAGGSSERRTNMTKEEKRARMLAAEQRARERAARRAAGEPPSQDARPRERQPSGGYQNGPPPGLAAAAPVVAERPIPRERPVQRSVSAREPQPLSQPPPRDQQNYASGALPAPERTAPLQADPDSGIPKRNLSFRERAVRNDGGPSGEETSPYSQPPGPARNGSLSLTRSGSNKLRKEPPGDPWYHARNDAERRMPSIGRPNSPLGSRRGQGQQAVPRSMRDKELPPDPPVSEQRRAPVEAGRAAVMPMPGDNIQVVRRSVTEPIRAPEYDSDEAHLEPPTRGNLLDQDEQRRAPPQEVAAARRRLERQDSDSSDSGPHHRIAGKLFKGRESMRAGDGLYNPPQWLDEWKKGTVGTLSGPLLDVTDDHLTTIDKNKAWWEVSGRRGSNSTASRPRKAEAFDGEYDETNAPSRFKPALYLKCGPLLRYCGIRQEKVATRSQRTSDREMWRGSVMIVTKDSESSYEIAPTLRLFVQDLELLPPPPHRVNGELSPEYVDPIAGHPKLGRRGETMYVRPVEHLDEAKDLSQDETDNGLFEKTRSPPDISPPDGSTELPGSFASRRKRIGTDGEKMQKYKDVRGFRLHTERGYTFWRFNIEVELRDKQQRIAYRINRGPSLGFWVPARGQSMNMMFYSCNGFSTSVKPDELSGPDPMWRDVLNTHQSQPFHAMLGGGDQIYNDCVADECELFDEWLDIRNPLHKHNAPLTPEMQSELEEFYFERYSMWFSQGFFGLANSQIPMVNMYDDHDIFDGYGSYPHHDMNSPVFSGLGAVAFKYYMLFQHQSIITETEKTEPSWIVGIEPGPYIREQSRSLYMSMGGKTALLAVDTRTERTEHEVINDKSWEKIMNRLYAEVRRGQVEHLLVLLGVPIAYPRLVWLENILTSRLMDPVKALGKTGVFGKVMNNIDGGVEVLDDLNDHWTAKNHKHERSIVIEDLQDLAIDKSLRITILSGDVHLAAAGQFYSNPKLGLAKHKDPRYMPNIISSAIVNTPPPDMMADVLNRRNKIHHFDKQTDEDMIPMFRQGVDGKPRNNKRLLPHRNWCSIRQWTPGTTPPPTPPQSRTPSPPPAPGGGILRKLSLSRNRGPSSSQNASRDSVRGSRPPVSGGGGLFRSLSRRMSTDKERPAKLTRTLSLGRGESQDRGEPQTRGFFGFGRRDSQRRPNDGGINGQWGAESEDDDEYYDTPEPNRPRPSGLRGGAAYDEFSEGDDSYFTAQPPRRAQTLGSRPPPPAVNDEEEPPRRPFHRTPTGLSVKQMRKAENFEVDLEGGLDICLNVEVNPKDPTGITMPYRLLVPKLFYEYTPGDDELPPPAEPSGFKRLLSFRKKQPGPARGGPESYDNGQEEEYYQGR